MVLLLAVVQSLLGNVSAGSLLQSLGVAGLETVELVIGLLLLCLACCMARVEYSHQG